MAYPAGPIRTALATRGLADSLAAEPRRSTDAQLRATATRLVTLVDDYDIGGRRRAVSPGLPFLPSARDLGLHLVLARPVAGAVRLRTT